MSEDERAKKKKAAVLRKKQALIAKMKAKQASKLPTALVAAQDEESKDVDVGVKAGLAVPMEVDTPTKAGA